MYSGHFNRSTRTSLWMYTWRYSSTQKRLPQRVIFNGWYQDFGRTNGSHRAWFMVILSKVIIKDRILHLRVELIHRLWLGSTGSQLLFLFFISSYQTLYPRSLHSLSILGFCESNVEINVPGHLWRHCKPPPPLRIHQSWHFTNSLQITQCIEMNVSRKYLLWNQNGWYLPSTVSARYQISALLRGLS